MARWSGDLRTLGWRGLTFEQHIMSYPVSSLKSTDNFRWNPQQNEVFQNALNASSNRPWSDFLKANPNMTEAKLKMFFSHDYVENQLWGKLGFQQLVQARFGQHRELVTAKVQSILWARYRSMRNVKPPNMTEPPLYSPHPLGETAQPMGLMSGASHPAMAGPAGPRLLDPAHGGRVEESVPSSNETRALNNTCSLTNRFDEMTLPEGDDDDEDSPAVRDALRLLEQVKNKAAQKAQREARKLADIQRQINDVETPAPASATSYVSMSSPPTHGRFPPAPWNPAPPTAAPGGFASPVIPGPTGNEGEFLCVPTPLVQC